MTPKKRDPGLPEIFGGLFFALFSATGLASQLSLLTGPGAAFLASLRFPPGADPAVFHLPVGRLPTDPLPDIPPESGYADNQYEPVFELKPHEVNTALDLMLDATREAARNIHADPALSPTQKGEELNLLSRNSKLATSAWNAWQRTHQNQSFKPDKTPLSELQKDVAKAQLEAAKKSLSKMFDVVANEIEQLPDTQMSPEMKADKILQINQARDDLDKVFEKFAEAIDARPDAPSVDGVPSGSVHTNEVNDVPSGNVHTNEVNDVPSGNVHTNEVKPRRRRRR